MWLRARRPSRRTRSGGSEGSLRCGRVRPRAVSPGKNLGHKVVFGDASRKRVLEAAGVSRARTIVVTFDRHHAVKRLLHNAHQANPNVSSIVSATDDQDVAALVTAGAGAVFPENFAAGLGLADQVLLSCGFSQEDAADIVTTVRAELNPELSGRVGI